MRGSEVIATLKARRALLAVVCLLAASAGALMFRSAHTVPSGVAVSQLLVDAPASAVGDLRTDPGPLIQRAGAITQLMTSDAVLQRIAAAARIPAGEITAEGPYVGPAAIYNVVTPAEARSTQLVANARSYRLSFTQRTDLPVITVTAQAPDATAAVKLANAAYAGLNGYLRTLGSGPAQPHFGITVRQLGSPMPDSTNASTPKILAAVTAFGMFLLGVLAILAWEVMRSRALDLRALEREHAEDATVLTHSRHRRARGFALVAAVALVASLLSGYRVSFLPPALHPRDVQIAAAKAELLIDTPISNLVDAQQDSLDPPNQAVTYSLFLKTDAIRLKLAADLGLAGKAVEVNGPYTLLLDRRNYAQAQSLPVTIQTDNRFRLLVDVDGAHPMLTLYGQAPTTRDAVRLVQAARALLVQHVAELEAQGSVDRNSQAVLRPLGGITAGVVNPGARLQLLALILLVILLAGGAIVVAYDGHRRRSALGSGSNHSLRALPPAVPGKDDWPHTTRLLPWGCAAFLGMIYVVPFDSISLPVHLPLDSTPDRILLVALVGIWILAMMFGRREDRPRIRLSPVHFALLGFMAIAWLSVAASGHTLANLSEVQPVLKKLVLLATFVAFFFVVSSSIRPGEVARFTKMIVVLAALVGVATIIEYRFRYNVFLSVWGAILPVQLPSDLGLRDSIGRITVYGPTTQGLELATLLAMSLPFAIVGMFDQPSRRRRLWYGLAAALILAGGLSTSKKTAVVTPVAGILVIAAYRPRTTIKRLVRLAPGMLIVIHFAAGGAIGTVLDELLPGRVNTALTTTDRVARYDAIRPDVVSHLVLGRGFQSYDPHKYRILDNEYLALIIGVGIVGLAAYLLISGTLLTIAHTIVRRADRTRAGPALAGLSAVVIFVVANALFDVLSFPHVPYLLFFIAAMILVLRERSPSASLSLAPSAGGQRRAAAFRPGSDGGASRSVMKTRS